MMREWAASDSIGVVYVWPKDPIYKPVGAPKVGTWILCAEHSGDNFYEYIPLNHYKGAYGQVVLEPKLKKAFGTYGGFQKAPVKLSNRHFHLLMAGEVVQDFAGNL